MNQIKITSSNIDIIRDDIKELLMPLHEKYGITIKLGNTSYDDTHFKTPLTVLSGDGSAQEKEIWEKNARFLGLNEEWFGKTFINKEGISCVVTGINPKAYKMPIKYMEVVSGKRYKTSASNLISTMALKINTQVIK